MKNLTFISALVITILAFGSTALAQSSTNWVILSGEHKNGGDELKVTMYVDDWNEFEEIGQPDYYMECEFYIVVGANVETQEPILGWGANKQKLIPSFGDFMTGKMTYTAKTPGDLPHAADGKYKVRCRAKQKVITTSGETHIFAVTDWIEHEVTVDHDTGGETGGDTAGGVGQ